MNPQHAALLNQLRDHLDAELGLHRRLLALAEEKVASVVAHDLPAFTAQLAREQALVAEMARLRQVRERLLRAVGAVFALRGDQLTMTQVIAKVDQSHGAELARRQQELRGVIERLRGANDRLLMLLRSGLSLVRDILQAVMGGDGGQHAYDRRGSAGSALPTRGQLINLAG